MIKESFGILHCVAVRQKQILHVIMSVLAIKNKTIRLVNAFAFKI